MQTDEDFANEWGRAVARKRADTRHYVFSVAMGLLAGVVVSSLVVPVVIFGIMYALWAPNAAPGDSFFQQVSQMTYNGGGMGAGAGRGLAFLLLPGVLTGMYVFRRLRRRAT